MARCPICNDFVFGQAESLPYITWVAQALNSSCHYCQLLVSSIQALNSNFLTEEPQHHHRGQSATQSLVNINVKIEDQGRIYIYSLCSGWGRVEVGLQFFRTEHVNTQTCAIGPFQLPLRGDIAPVPGDPSMWKFLRSSLQTCLKEHPACKEEQDTTWFPERLLSLQRSSRADENPTTVQLIESRHQRPESAYIALSHCWGSEPFVCTTSENIQSHKNVIDTSKLPRTFQDAITAAQQLDVSYIWIDSLCIIQNEEEDWARHAEQMDKIYQNALVVVAAVSSSNSSVPFLGPDAPTERHTYQTVNIPYPTSGTKKNMKPNTNHSTTTPSTFRVRPLDPTLQPSWLHGPLEHRAWAFQERYLATRIISLTSTESKYQCATSLTCECLGTLQTKPRLPDDELQPPSVQNQRAVILSKWRDVVKQYAMRNLTYNTDKLPAIAGIASRFHSLLRTEYMAGMWQSDMPFNLAWFRREMTDCPTDTPVLLPSMGNGVPSWSWASGYGTCWWLWEYYFQPLTQLGMDAHPHLDIQLVSKVEVVKVNCVPSATNVFGALEPGSFIELKGQVVPAVMECDAFGCASVRREGGFEPQLVILDCRMTGVGDSVGGGTYGNGDIRRAESFDYEDEGNLTHTPDWNPNTRIQGNVICLLLYSGTFEGQSKACVLILGRVMHEGKLVYQRLGLGCGRFEKWSGPLYDVRKSWAPWERWEDLEQWEEWERWFEDAELETVKIV